MDIAKERITWKNSTTVILASGPSLTDEDINVARRSWGNSPLTKIIAINETWRRCDIAHVLYGADPEWWEDRGPALKKFHGELWTQDKNWPANRATDWGIRQIKSEYGADISTDPSFIYQGANSAFQAMNLAILFGSRKIVFLGLDLGRSPEGETHWHKYPDKFERSDPEHSYNLFRNSFNAAAPKLQRLGVEVINASRRTTLKCFKRMTIQEALQ